MGGAELLRRINFANLPSTANNEAEHQALMQYVRRSELKKKAAAAITTSFLCIKYLQAFPQILHIRSCNSTITTLLVCGQDASV